MREPGPEGAGEKDGREAATAAAARCWAALRRRFPSRDLDHDEVLAGIAAGVGDAQPEVVLARLDEASRVLFGSASAPLVEQAARLEPLIAGLAGPTPADDDYRALLLDRALARRLTHPILLAAVGHELARRAGLTSRVCRSPEGWWTALIGPDGCVLVGSAAATPPSSLDDVRLACAHEVAVAVLARLRALAPPPGDRRAERMLQELLEAAGADGHGHGHG